MLNKLKYIFLARYRNYAFWISLSSAIMLFLSTIGIEVDNDKVMNISRAILGVFVVAGIVNDPTTIGRGYSDDVIKTYFVPDEGITYKVESKK